MSRVVTFGQPKVTDADGAKKFRDLPLVRIVNVNDPVPLVPPLEIKYLKKPYAHLGVEVTLLDGPFYSYLEEGNNADGVGLAFWESLKSTDQVKANLLSTLWRLTASISCRKFLGRDGSPYADRMEHFKEPTPK
ncbi:MAG: hypothetical protein IPP35_12580 [Elusimicrobia bacterium]|nr:hypothetical protein [Elusimicrobiota bacterium]